MENVITKETSKKITFIQVVFTIMVVYIHAYNLEIYAITNAGGISSVCYYLERIMYYVSVVAVPGFFFLSGYLFYATLTKKNIIKKYRSRLFSLVIPYIIWNFVGYLFWIVLENIPAIAQRLSTQHLWTISIKSIGYAFVLPVNSPLWYMRNLFAVLLLAVPVWFVVKKKWGIILLVGLLVISILIKADKYNLVYDLFLFALGGYVVLNFNDWFQRENKISRIIGSSIIWAFVLISVIFPEVDFQDYRIQLVSDTILFMSVWFSFIPDRLSNNGILRRISNSRTFIYFAHSIILESMEKAFFLMLGQNKWFAIIDYTLMPVVVISFLLVMSSFIRKHCPIGWKIINGFR